MQNRITNQRLEALERRLDNLFRYGTVHSVDYKAARAQVDVGSGALTPPLRWWVARAAGDVSWWAPEVGEQVAVISPNGELESGVIFPSLYQEAYPPVSDSPDVHKTVYKDGSYDEYNRKTHDRTIRVIGGNTHIIVDKVVNVHAGEDINLLADGNINIDAGGNINTSAGAHIELSAPTTGMDTVLTQGEGSHGGKAVFKNDLHTEGQITSDKKIESAVDCISDGISGKGHTHNCPHGGTTGAPK